MSKEEFSVSMKIKNVSGRHPYVEEETGFMPVSKGIDLLLDKYSNKRTSVFSLIGRDLDLTALEVEKFVSKLRKK